MNYGIQLYSIRDIAKKDLALAVAKVANIGYSMVEFAGFFEKKADEVNEILKENNITLWGTHTGIDDLVEDYDKTVAFHKAIGNKNYIIPMHDLSSQSKIDEFVWLVNKYQPMLEKEGIRLAYHNHSGEFTINEDGSDIYNSILQRTNVYLEIDTYWVFNAGLDPVEMMEKYKNRIICIHLKDGLQHGKGKPLGKGIAPVSAVHNKAKALNIPIIVESETLTPSGEEECRICFDYLKTLQNK